MITTVTGVLMIIMLLLSLEVGRREADARPAETARAPAGQEPAQLRQQLEASLQTLDQRQTELSRLSNRVFVLREADRSGKRPVLVALSANQAACSRLGQTNLIQFPISGGNTGFRQLLEQFDPRTERLVFYIRPSGVTAFDACRALAEQRGFAIGYDAAEEHKQYFLTASPGP
jgi:hypothetical protein